MINQMWSQKLFDMCGQWEKEFECWAFTQGLINPVEWIKSRGIGNYTKQEYNEMIQSNIVKSRELREQYQLINPYPVKRFKGQ